MSYKEAVIPLNCRLLIASDTFCLNDHIKSNKEIYAEVMKYGKIKDDIMFPIVGKCYGIEVDLTNLVNVAFCSNVAVRLAESGCRVFVGNGAYFIATILSEDELKKKFSEVTNEIATTPRFYLKELPMWEEATGLSINSSIRTI